MTMNISLPAEMEARVREHVANGLYGSASEVVREALRLFEAYQSVRATALVALRSDLEKGMADPNARQTPGFSPGKDSAASTQCLPTCLLTSPILCLCKGYPLSSSDHKYWVNNQH